MTGFFDKLQSFVRGKDAEPSNGIPPYPTKSSSDIVSNPPSSLGASLFPTQASNPSTDSSPLRDSIAEPESLPPEAFPRTSGNGTPPPPSTPSASSPPLYSRWSAWVLMSLLLGTGGLAGASFYAIREIQASLPEPKEALSFVRDGTLTIKGSDGSILQQLGPATRSTLKVDAMPPEVAEAFLASEDRDFYEHGGVDYKAIVRAILANLSAGEVVEGASTITQQLTRIVFLDQDQTLERKIREALLAHKMEQSLTKDQILERYINLVYLGGGAYGVSDAAWVYFSKSPNELTLPEIAMIVGLAPAPSEYSPLVNKDAALQRRNIVLARMEEAGFITAQEREEAQNSPLALEPQTPRNLDSRFPYFTQYVQQQLSKLVDPEEIEVGGLTIETTLNPKWQEHAQETVNEAIARYGRGQRFSQASMVAIDPRSGEIKAMVGGNDFSESQFNRVVQAQRQPGSTFKTFVYTTAIAAGFSPYKTYVDAKLMVDGYEPKNYGENFSGTQTMREALIRSVNIIAVKVLLDVGFDPVIQMAQKMGIQSKMIPAYSLALGSVEVNLLELTGAYGTLANRGKHVEPHGIRRVINRKGEVIYEAKYTAEQAVDQASADIMTWMLRGVVMNGTGANAGLRDRPVAGKTGTSELRRDLWFIGYIPQMVTGVWLGNDNNTPTRGASSTAARVWRNFMGDVVEGMEVEQFPELPRLRGREATVKAERIRPRRLVQGKAADTNERNERSSRSDDEPRRTRTRSRRQSEEAPSEPRRSRESRTSRPSASPSSPSRFERLQEAPRTEPRSRPEAPPPEPPAPPPRRQDPAPPPPAAEAPAPPPQPEPQAPAEPDSPPAE
ncbi:MULTISPECIES: penicillin-binding protein 1A [unclassified Leptolyngbya]|uniref:PBP1A family penicillin-binding protein n=1 Tax=unclassified Leptolyngbya TaxID=2650499 RepID=UPI0018F005D0